MSTKQNQTPFFSKLTEYIDKKIIQHDVPGHKLGQIDNELLRYAGKEMFLLDANAPRGLDNLSNPKTVIKDAEKLMAEAFKADKAFFLTGGTSMGILAMILATCRANDKIIMPRNVHKSAISALILSGALPVFVKPQIDDILGIANQVSFNDFKQVIDDNLDAKAVFIINPTYFGVVTDLKKIIDYAHLHEMTVLVDEAHGSHFEFSKELPLSAMKAGADLSSGSLHKTVGSLTQSSVLFSKGKLVDNVRLKSTINMLQSTSPSSLLMASLDVARKYVYFEGPRLLSNVIKYASDAREKINNIKGLSAIGKQYFIDKGAYNYDETKIIINVSKLGITGFTAYKELFDEHNIQLELAETNLILAVLSIGTKEEDIIALVKALEKLSNKYFDDAKPTRQKINYTEPILAVRPRNAYHAPKKYVKYSDAYNLIAAESIMIYPPGIPIVIPGEVITKDVLRDLRFYEKTGSVILSETAKGFIKVIDEENWEE